MNNLLPGEGSTKHPALPSLAAAALTRRAALPVRIGQGQRGISLRGSGTPAKGLALECQDESEGAPGLPGSTCLAACPAGAQSSLAQGLPLLTISLASRDDLGLGQCQDSPTPSYPARCPHSPTVAPLAPAAPGEHQFGSRRAAGAPGSRTGLHRHLPWGCGGADGGMQGQERAPAPDTGATPFLGKRGLTMEERHICQACLCFQVPMSHPSRPQGGGRAERARSQRS